MAAKIRTKSATNTPPLKKTAFFKVRGCSPHPHPAKNWCLKRGRVPKKVLYRALPYLPPPPPSSLILFFETPKTLIKQHFKAETTKEFPLMQLFIKKGPKFGQGPHSPLSGKDRKKTFLFSGTLPKLHMIFGSSLCNNVIIRPFGDDSGPYFELCSCHQP